jgi:hypothetical protein
MDANLFGLIEADQTLSGTWSSGTDPNQCVFSFSPAFTTGPITYSAYPVSANEAFLVETDQVSGTGSTPFVSVIDMLQQTGQPFQTQNTIAGPLAGGLVGNSVDGGIILPEAGIVQISVANSGAGNFDFLYTDNTASTVTSNMASLSVAANPLSVSYSSDQFGRITTTLASPYFQPVLYLVSATEGFMLTSSAQLGSQPPLLGHLFAQSAGPFTATSLSGTFVEGSTVPATAAARNLSGFLTLDGVSSTIIGTQDESTTATNTPAEAITGSYSLFDTADGTGSIAINSPLSLPTAFTGAFVIVSPTKFVFITTTSNDTNPVLIVAGH